MASVLDQSGWQRRSASRDNVPQFCFSDEQISASHMVSQGPGWNAMIEGAHTVSNGLRITVYSHDSNSVNWEVW